MKIRIVSIFVALILILSISAQMNAQADSQPTISNIAGTIRNNGNGWETINNSTHMALNITKVETLNDRIIIHHDVKAKKVITFIVTPDEAMTQDGYTVGVSGGLNYSVIFIYDRDHNKISPSKYINTSGNIWIYGMLAQ